MVIIVGHFDRFWIDSLFRLMMALLVIVIGYLSDFFVSIASF